MSCHDVIMLPMRPTTNYKAPCQLTWKGYLELYLSDIKSRIITSMSSYLCRQREAKGMHTHQQQVLPQSSKTSKGLMTQQFGLCDSPKGLEQWEENHCSRVMIQLIYTWFSKLWWKNSPGLNRKIPCCSFHYKCTLECKV